MEATNVTKVLMKLNKSVKIRTKRKLEAIHVARDRYLCWWNDKVGICYHSEKSN
jgi:hypothetical protein